MTIDFNQKSLLIKPIKGGIPDTLKNKIVNKVEMDLFLLYILNKSERYTILFLPLTKIFKSNENNKSILNIYIIKYIKLVSTRKELLFTIENKKKPFIVIALKLISFLILRCTKVPTEPNNKVNIAIIYIMNCFNLIKSNNK
jgi:hypothetical protein